MKPTREPLIISVPKPCHQNWHEMKEEGTGRFCRHCQQTVIDFSGLTNAEVYAYFKNAQTIACGRFHRSQLNTTLYSQEKMRARWKTFYRKAAALFFFLTLKNASFFAQTKEATTTQPILRKAVPDTTKQNVIISGTARDTDGMAIQNAEISFNAITVAKTGDDGTFSFETSVDPLSKASVLKVIYPGLMAVVRSYHPAMQSASYSIVLEKTAFRQRVHGWCTGNLQRIQSPELSSAKGNDRGVQKKIG